MPEIDQQIAQRISNCARAVNIAKSTLERAKTFEDRISAQRELEAREREMQDAAMAVNRGISRPGPNASPAS